MCAPGPASLNYRVISGGAFPGHPATSDLIFHGTTGQTTIALNFRVAWGIST